MTRKVLALLMLAGCNDSNGMNGAIGPAGSPGAMGATGEMGATGATGPMGAPGLPSPQFATTVFVHPGDDLIAALAGITDASASKPYLLKLEPGVYDIGATTLQAKSFVDMEGSGEGVTTISHSGGSSSVGLRMANNVEVRELTVSYGDSNPAFPAISASALNGHVSLRNVTINSNAAGISNRRSGSGGSSTFTDLTINVAGSSGPGIASGNNGTGGARYEHIVINATATVVNGILLDAGSDSFLDVRVSGFVNTLFVQGDPAAPGNQTFDLLKSSPSTSSLNMFAASGLTNTITIRDSVLLGTINAINSGGGTLTVNIVNSQIPSVSDIARVGTPTFNCFGNYSASFAAAACE